MAGIDTYGECGGDARIIASIEDPAVIRKNTRSPGQQCNISRNRFVARLAQTSRGPG
jgi:hypothetical protein